MARLAATLQPQAPPAPDGDVLIEFRDVHKSFGDKIILNGASFQIRRGEAVGIIGASGTGKSTALRIAAGLLAPDSGEVLIMGRPRQGLLSDETEEARLSVGMVFQNAALFDSLTVGENVGFLLYEVRRVQCSPPAAVACMRLTHACSTPTCQRPRLGSKWQTAWRK
jgi:ABC-type transporter Mla maintaining outer membrane lipid asymmetry ATPase subunit MlaF